MRAAVVQRYGPPEVVQVEQRPDPTARGNEVLVRVTAAAVSSGDARMRAGRFPPGFAPLARLAIGVRGPRRAVLGSAFCGVVEAIGDRASTTDGDGVHVGQRVCAMTRTRLGAHAELLTWRADRVVPVPAAVSDDDAAGVLFGGTTALHFLQRRVGVAAGDRVLINGASGAVGTNAVQLARLAGATVTGICSAENADLVRELGATEVVERSGDAVPTIEGRYDVVVDAVGNLDLSSGRALLAPGGRLVLAVASLGQTLLARGDAMAGVSGERVEDMAQLIGLIASGDLRVVHDAAYPLEQIAEAHRRVDSGRKVGNVIVHP